MSAGGKIGHEALPKYAPLQQSKLIVLSQSAIDHLSAKNVMNIIKTHNWYYTQKDEPRGYIDPHTLSELWFHVGTACNLSCSFCLEGSKPGDTRLQPMTLTDVKPYIDQAVELDVGRFSFTGGEPFVIKEFHQILSYAAQYRPCLVLTNGTKPLHQRLHQLQPLIEAKRSVSFRISIDHPQRQAHEVMRGNGSFDEALEGIKALAELGFDVSVARQMMADEDSAAVEFQYRQLFRQNGLPEDVPLVSFPDFLAPFAEAAVPEISTHCMTAYQNDVSRRKFMCAYSKMIIKKDAQMRVYACTLVDDDARYDLGPSLQDSVKQRIILKHHRCYSCFAYGASCSG